MEPASADRGGADFEQLLDQARQGCRESLGKLLEICREYLQQRGHVHIEQRLKPKDAPSDLLQQTFLEAIRDFPQFRGQSREKFLGWILRILQHNQRNFERSFTRARRDITAEVRLDDPHVMGDLKDRLRARTPTPSSEIVHREEGQSVDRAMDTIPEHYRLILRLRTIEHRSFEEIAERVGNSAEAVRQIWHRAMRQLAAALKGRKED